MSWGNISGDTYYTVRRGQPRTGESHFMGIMQGYGISVSKLEECQRRNVKWVQIKYIGKAGTKVLRVSLDKYLNSEYTHTYESIDEQRFVKESEFEVLSTNQTRRKQYA